MRIGTAASERITDNSSSEPGGNPAGRVPAGGAAGRCWAGARPSQGAYRDAGERLWQGRADGKRRRGVFKSGISAHAFRDGARCETDQVGCAKIRVDCTVTDSYRSPSPKLSLWL